MSQQKPRLKRPLEQVRAELLADSDTQRIAQAVGMELEAYVELVLDYARNPDKQPVLAVASDEELRANGYEPPSAEDVANFFIAGARGELGIGGPQFHTSEFTSGPATDAGKPSLTGESRQAPLVPDDPEKRQELLNQLKKGGSGGRV